MESLPDRRDANKKRLVTIGKIISKGAAGSVIPMGGMFVDLIEQSMIWLRDKHHRESEDRLVVFNRIILESNDRIDINDIIDNEFDEDDYYSILKNILSDEEKEKTKYYSIFFKALVKGCIPQEHKNFLIKVLRKLSMSDIDLLKDYYAASIAFKLFPFADKLWKNPLGSSDPLIASSANSLKWLGLILDKDNSFKVTRPLEVLAIILFDNEAILSKLDTVRPPKQGLSYIIAFDNLPLHEKLINKLEVCVPGISFPIIVHTSRLRPLDFKKQIIFVVSNDISDFIEKHELYNNKKTIIIYHNTPIEYEITHEYPKVFYISKDELPSDSSVCRFLANELHSHRGKNEEYFNSSIADARIKLCECIDEERKAIGLL